jgi:hypothetical protein
MSETKKIYLTTFPIEAGSLEQTLALLTEIHQRTGFSPDTITTPDGTTTAWNATLAFKVATGKVSEAGYIKRCSIDSR